MPQSSTCPHSSIGVCVPCYHERVAADVDVVEFSGDTFEFCICGREMRCIFRGHEDDYHSAGIRVEWCEGCGVVHVHKEYASYDSRYIPDPKLIGNR